jgi:hypothetical protein
MIFTPTQGCAAMAQSDSYSEPMGDARPPALSVAALLTPESTAITAATLAYLSVFDAGGVASAIQATFGWSFGFDDSYASNIAAAGLFMILAAVGATVLGLRVVRLAPAQQRWAGHLARASILVAALGAVLGVITVVGALARA